MNPKSLIPVRIASVGLTLLVSWGCTESKTPVPAPALDGVASNSKQESNYSAARELIERCKRQTATELVIRSPVSLDQLLAISENPQLHTLELYAAHFSPTDLDCLASLSQLRRLRLEDLALHDRSIVSLWEMPHLEILNIPATVLTDSGVKTLVARLSGLQLLRIGSPHITDTGIATLSELQSLRFLHLVDIPVTDAGLIHFHDMHSLESFYIDGGQETEPGIRELLRANPQLHFHRNQLHIPDDPLAD